jgi:hypothetical protein
MPIKNEFSDELKAMAWMIGKKANVAPKWPEGVDRNNYPPVVIGGHRFTSFEHYEIRKSGEILDAYGAKIETVSEEEKQELAKKGILTAYKGKSFTQRLSK